MDVEWGMPATGLLRGVAIDIAVWFCLPLAFLILYAGVLGRPASRRVAHVLAMALPFLLQAFLRLVLSRGIPHAGLRRADLLAGHRAAHRRDDHLLRARRDQRPFLGQRGRVVRDSHLLQAGARCRRGGRSTVARRGRRRDSPDGVHPGGMLVLSEALRLDAGTWTIRVGEGRLCSRRLLRPVDQVASATEAPWIAQEEPLSMSLFPLADTRDIEGHRVTVEEASARDALEDRARAKYEPAAAGSSKPNVILIVVDAMRPANMSLFGYARETTPYLDSLARTVPVRKFITHAPCSDTACGLISLTTSRPPRDFSFRPFGLHEALRRNGYRTHVIQSGTYLHPVREYYGELDVVRWHVRENDVDQRRPDDRRQAG